MKTRKNRFIVIVLCLSLVLGTVPAFADSDLVSKDALRGIVTSKVDTLSLGQSGLDGIINSINNTVTQTVTSTIQRIVTPDTLKTIAAPLISGAIKTALIGYGLNLPDSVDVDSIIDDIMGNQIVDTILSSDIVAEILERTIEYAVADVMSMIQLPTSGDIIAAQKEELIQKLTDNVFGADMLRVDITNSNSPRVKSFLPVGTTAATPNLNASFYDFTVTEWNQVSVPFLGKVNSSVKSIQINGWHTSNINTYIDLENLKISLDGVKAPDISNIDFESIVLNALKRAARDVIQEKIQKIMNEIKSAAEKAITDAKAEAISRANDIFQGMGLSVNLTVNDTEEEMLQKIEDALKDLASDKKDELLDKLSALKNSLKIKYVPKAVRIIDRMIDTVRSIKPVVDIKHQLVLTSSLEGEQLITVPESGSETITYTAKGEFSLKYMDLSGCPVTGVWTEWKEDTCKKPVITTSLNDESGAIAGVSWNASTNQIIVAADAGEGSVTITATYNPVGCTVLTETMTLVIERQSKNEPDPRPTPDPDPTPTPDPDPTPAPDPAPVIVTASAPLTYYTLTVQIEGAGNLLPASGGSYTSGTVVLFSGVNAAEGWHFDGLYVGDTKLSETRVVMDGNKTVIARFVEIIDVQVEDVPQSVPAASPMEEAAAQPLDVESLEVTNEDENQKQADSSVEVIVLDESVPADAPVLPQTGGVPAVVLYAAGTVLTGIGLLIKKKKEDKEEKE